MRRPGAAPVRGPVRLLAASLGAPVLALAEGGRPPPLSLCSRPVPRRLLRLSRSSGGLTIGVRGPLTADFGFQMAAGTPGFCK
ncbi:hypothetical protein NDU88_002513 [Pleurodeles waltl]|uniref:Uncharacterized protein n=1 Tax=Pleurodeles waltl TaxID=8319 RepID=A0AAV7Q7B4_PLEWA|nr:hypothetical protein NDU88_002513 [Pleurodeles waltl]